MAKREPVRIGIVGLGRAGWSMHCSELEGRKDTFTIVAACDVQKARRDQMAARYGCATYARIEDLIADPAVELVDIATRSVDHVPHALLALKAGKAVFLEKPIASTYRDACKLKPAARKAGGKLFVRHNRRFEPAFQHIREIMASGVLGDVFEIRLRRNGYQRRDDWQTLMRFGGGQMLNWGPHIIDHGLRLLEAPVAEQWSDAKRIAAVGDAEDHFRIILKGTNGRIVDIEISGGAAVPEPEYIVLGSKGGLSCDGSAIQLRYLDPKRKLQRRQAKASTPPVAGGFGKPEVLRWIEKTVVVKPKKPCSMDGIWDHLYAALREGKPFPITLDEALGVMAVTARAKKGTPFAARP